MTDNHSIADPFGRIADEFVNEYRQGRRPSVDEFARRYPDQAAEIRAILPTLVLMERAKSAGGSSDIDLSRVADGAPLVGRELGDYRIIRLVGRGGMGMVYEAEQISLGRRVALKVLARNTTLDSKQRRRFEREARAAARLHHTNIVPVFGVGEDDGLCYYVMQYIRGLGLDAVLNELKRISNNSSGSGHGSLGEVRISRGPCTSATAMARVLLSGQFDPQVLFSDPAGEIDADQPANSPLAEPNTPELPGEPGDSFVVSDNQTERSAADSPATAIPGATYWHSIARIGVQAAEALQYAHEQGITHRDIKPSNLLLDLQGTVWVTDFGLAKSDDQQNLTHSGDILGTIRYLPPEAFEGRSDPRSDVYSLGLTLYELLTLSPAFSDVDRRKLIKAVTTDRPQRIERLQSDVPRDLATIVHKAIERDMLDRYATARELADDLRRYLNDEPIKARRTSLVEQVRRWSRHNRALAAAMAGIVSLLVVIAIGSILAAVHFRRQEETQRLLRAEADELAKHNEQLAVENHSALVNALDTSRHLDLARSQAEQQQQVTRKLLYNAQMSVAHEAWTRHRGMMRTQRMLDEWRPKSGQPDLRGWEWYYIQSLCHHEQLALQGHREAITCVAYGPDGRTLASGDRDGEVRLWSDVAPDRPTVLRGHSGFVYALAWDSTGDRLAVAANDGVTIWDTRRQEILRHLPTAHATFSVAFAPHGGTVAAGELNGPIHIWDPSTGQRLQTLQGHKADVYTQTISFNPEGTLLAAPAELRTLVWSVPTGEVRFVLAGHTDRTQAAVFSPDGSRLATSSRDATIRIWDMTTGREMARLSGHTHGVGALAWHPQGHQLLSGAWDGSCRLWDLTTMQELGVPRGQGRHVFAVAWHPNGNQFATGGDDNLVKIWSASQLDETRLLVNSQDLVRSIDTSLDGQTLAIGHAADGVSVWDLGTGTLRYRFDTPPGVVRRIAMNQRVPRLAAACADGSIPIWDVATGQLVRVFLGHDTAASAVTWDSSGQWLASADRQGIIHVWNAQSGEREQSLTGLGLGGMELSFAPSGRRLAAADGEGTLWIWDLDSGTRQPLLGHLSMISDIAWSPDGTWLATAGDDHTVRVWNVAECVEVFVLQGHSEVVAAVSFSADGQRLLSADTRGNVLLWDVSAGIPTMTLRGPVGRMLSARWSHDGLQILAACERSVLAWDASAGYRLEGRAARPGEISARLAEP